ncbi:MAG: hypothetical protein ABI091_01780, partial [Ferruginibacter sp.]
KQSLQVTATIESVLEGMAYVQIEAINTQSNLTGPNIRTLTTDTTGLVTPIKLLGFISIKERGWLKQLFSDMQKDLQAVVAASQSTFTADSQNLNAAIIQLNNAIAGTKITDVRSLDNAKALVDSFSATDVTLQMLTGTGKKKIPYTDVKNKKNLYSYILATLNGLKAFYVAADAKVKALKYIEKTQRIRIQQLQASIQTILNNAIASTDKIHQDAAWKKYIQEMVTPLVAELIAISNAFANATLPLLNNLPAPPVMQTGDVFFSGIKALVKIKRFNLQGSQKYDVIKKYKDYLEPRITSLTRTLQSPIPESKPGQIQSLQNLFASINTEVQTSVTRIDNYNAANRSQSAGKGLISTYFNKSVISVIGGFAGVDINFPKPVFTPVAPQTINQLWVRIYPDDIFVTTHEEALTAAETEAGKQFWKTWWAAGSDTDLQMGAWQTLCIAFGNHRASWVARVLNPVNDPQNKIALQTSPSAKIIDANTLLDSVNTALKKLPLAGTAVNIVKAAITQKTVALLTTSFEKINAELASIKIEQDILLDKFKSLFINATALMKQLITKSQGLTRERQPTYILFINNLQMLVSQFNKMQSVFTKIKSLNHKDFVNSIDSPFVYPTVSSKDQDWSAAPHTSCMPDRFAVITMKGDQFTRIAVGNIIDQSLQLGLDPQKFDDLSLFTIDENGNMNIDDGLKWMT